jgi:putative selenium metabolism hydrolase
MNDWTTLRDDCVGFARRLIAIPAMSGEEGAIGAAVEAELRAIGVDEVWRDEVGNVFGRLHGHERHLPALLLNTHLDHVDPGDLALWPSPPYEGTLTDGALVGRGAADIKGPLATQVYALAAFTRTGRRPRRDVIFSAVVEEETTGRGARHLAATLPDPLALIVLGEPTSNQVAIGHRGICQLWVTLHGRSAHASAPERAENPLWNLATFLKRLRKQQKKLGTHPRLGPTTVSPTVVLVDTTSRNVTPAWVRVCLDFRTASETMGSLLGFVATVADGMAYTVGDAADAKPDTPVRLSADLITGFDTDPADEAVQEAVTLIGIGQGRTPDLVQYHFATDGRFMAHRAPIIGYAPADEDQAHTAGERIRLDRIEDSLRGHVVLLSRF